MPRKITQKIVERKELIYRYLLRSKVEVPTSSIMREMGLTHSQVFYILKMLMKEGRIEEIKKGKMAYWRARNE